MIAGSNVEVSNRLTLVRRPGNSIFGSGSGSFANSQLFDEFIVNKATSDVFGTTLEEIFTMVSEPGALWAIGPTGVEQPVFSDSAVTSPYYMQAVGNELYFSNGVDNKKWLQSLITWAPNFQIQGAQGNTGTYPFLDTYLLTGDAFTVVGPNTADTSAQVIQQLVGVAVAYIEYININNGVLEVHISNSAAPTNALTQGVWNVPPYQGATIPIFQLWGLNTATFLNGVIFSASNSTQIKIGTTTVITANLTGNAIGNFVVPTADQTWGSSGMPIPDTGWVMQIGSTPVVPETGTTVPVWGTYADYVSNTNDLWGAPVSEGGNFVLDGNLLWVNRGSNVENWGIAAPTVAITTSETNSTFSSWQADTYYSISGFIQSPASDGSRWYQVTIPGTTGLTWSATPISGQTAEFALLSPQPTGWQGTTLYNEGEYAGSYPWHIATVPPLIDNVQYQNGEYITVASNVAPSLPGIDPIYDNPQNSLVTNNGYLWQLQRQISQGNTIPTNVPVSVVYGGSYEGQIGSWIGPQVETAGWAVAGFGGCGYTNGGSGGFINIQFGSGIGSPYYYGTSTPRNPSFCTTSSSIMYNYFGDQTGFGPMDQGNLTDAGVLTNGSDIWPGRGADEFCLITWGKIRIPVPGMLVTFTFQASDATYFGIEADSGATYTSSTVITSQNGAPSNVSPTSYCFGTQTNTPWNGYPIMGGWNGPSNMGSFSVTLSFPVAGVFGMEVCYGKNSNGGSYDHIGLGVVANGSLMVPESSSTQPWFHSGPSTPAFPSNPFSTTFAAQNTYAKAPELTANPYLLGARNSFMGTIAALAQGQELVWMNLGPVSTMQWTPGISVALGDTAVIKAGYEYFAYEPGDTGSTTPTTWNSAIYSLTQDNGTLQWINEGSIPPITPATGTVLATSDQGWLYWIALVNTLDNTVSGLSPVSVGTGPVNGSVLIPPGSGLPNLTLIDPQADYVAVFRSVDGFTTPFLIPGYGNSIYTVPLTTYLQDGYIDSTPDTGLNNLIQGAQNGENSPPAPGAGSFTYHLGRIFYSIGNTVYYTTGPFATVGNGTGTAPSNFDTLPSRIVRMVPTAIGLLIFTISDIYIIQGAGTPNNPILPAIPYLQGVGLSNYNGLDIDGTLIGFFTTDKQFVILDPSAGLSYAGYPIGDQFRLNNGLPGTSWNTQTVSVSWYTFGEDQGWYVSDGQFGWYRLMATPAPEKGMCWSPFATITGGIGAVGSIQTQPGVHQLLMASNTGGILFRDLNSSVDEVSLSLPGVPYPAYAVFGSYVLATPGQVAKVSSITTESVNTGTPLTIGVIIDEALPYFHGSFDIIKRWEFDPPCLKPSKSFYSQRFYLSDDDEESAYCRTMQLLVQFAPENAASELITFSLFGAYEIEA